MDRYSRGTFTTPMPEFMRRHWESVNPFGLGNRERVPKLSGRPTDFNPLLMKMSEGKVEKVMGEPEKTAETYLASEFAPGSRNWRTQFRWEGNVPSEIKRTRAALDSLLGGRGSLGHAFSQGSLFKFLKNYRMHKDLGAHVDRIIPQMENTSYGPDVLRQHVLSKLWGDVTRSGAPHGLFGAKTAEGKVEKVMGEYKDRKLRSGKNGPIVKKRDQAIAIALSEAREAGEDVPEKKSEVKTMKISELSKIAADISAAQKSNTPEPKTAEDAYFEGALQKLAEAGFDEKQAQGFLESLKGQFIPGAAGGSDFFERLGNQAMSLPRWLGRNPGKGLLGAMMMPGLTAPMLGAGMLGRMMPKKQTMWERLRGGAGDVGERLRGLF